MIALILAQAAAYASAREDAVGRTRFHLDVLCRDDAAFPNLIPHAINNHNLVVGYTGSNDNLFRHAVVWRSCRRSYLEAGGSTSYALAVNDHDQIVGGAAIAGGVHGVIWRNGRMFDLNKLLSDAPGWTVTEADQINKHGQIIVRARRHGKKYCVLLNPS